MAMSLHGLRAQLLAAIAMGLFSVPAAAEPKAQELITACRGTDGSAPDAICRAYLNGFLDGEVYGKISMDQGKRVCLDGVSTSDIRRLILRVWDQHDLRTTTPGALIMAAIAQTYACK